MAYPYQPPSLTPPIAASGSPPVAAPVQTVVVGSQPGRMDSHDWSQEKHNLLIAVAGLVIAVVPFVEHVSTGYPYLDFAIVIVVAGGAGFCRRWLTCQQRTIVVQPPTPQQLPAPRPPMQPQNQSVGTKP